MTWASVHWEGGHRYPAHDDRGRHARSGGYPLLDRQCLARFIARQYGGTLHAVRVHALRGGLHAAGVFRVRAHIRSPAGRLQAVQFVVKVLHEEAPHELTMYRALQAGATEMIAPRLLDSAHTAAGSLLFLEWVQPIRPWPWRDVHTAVLVLTRLARLHQRPWPASPAATSQEAYEHALLQSGSATLDALQRVIRDSGATVLQGAVPMTTRLVEVLPAMRRVLLTASRPVWIHGDVHPGNVIIRRGPAGEEPVLLDWARARPGSPLEDVSAWMQSLGHWEPAARRAHDTLVRTYLAACGLEPVLDRPLRRLYWFAAASNALSGALRYYVCLVQSASTSAKRVAVLTLARRWLRPIRQADVSWRAG